MYGILVLCFGKDQNHMLPGCNYGGVYCLMYGMLVLGLGYLFYVWDTSLMYGILVWDISLMYGILVLCLGYLSYVCNYLVPSTWYQVRGWILQKEPGLKSRDPRSSFARHELYSFFERPHQPRGLVPYCSSLWLT